MSELTKKYAMQMAQPIDVSTKTQIISAFNEQKDTPKFKEQFAKKFGEQPTTPERYMELAMQHLTAIHERNFLSLEAEINAKNRSQLLEKLHRNNPNWVAFFAEMTGIKAALKTDKAIHAAIDAWCGYTPPPPPPPPPPKTSQTKEQRLAAMQTGRAAKALEKLISSRYGVTTEKEFIEKLVADSYRPSTKTLTGHQLGKFNRTRYNRMSRAEQDAYLKTLDSPVTTYRAEKDGSIYDLAKYAYDYMLLVAKEQS